MIDAATAKAIEPQVRAVIAETVEAKRIAQAAGHNELAERLYRIEYQLGGLLPAIHGTLRVPLDAAAMVPATFNVRAG